MVCSLVSLPVTVFVTSEKCNKSELNVLPLTLRGGEISPWISMLNCPVIEFAVMGKSKGPKPKMTLSLKSPLEKFSWSSPMPVDAARYVLNIRIKFCLLQRAEIGN